MTPQEWTRYYQATPLLAHRRQTAAFLAAYGWIPAPLHAHSKVALVGPPPPFPDWLDVDLPDPRNWSATLPKANPTFVWADIDCDTRPLSSATEWTEQLLSDAQQCQRIVSDALATFHVSCHRFGRDSLNSRGHAILPIDLSPQPGMRQTPLELLDLLHMKRKVRIGNLMVGLEIRRAAEKRLVIPRAITLPGSTYPSLLDKTQLDLIQWHDAADFQEGTLWNQTLSPQPLHELRMALYAAILAMGVMHHWVPGDRHSMSLIVAGALAHEASVGFLGNESAGSDDAARIFDFILSVVGDPEARDRRKVFQDTMNAMTAGRPVTGYRTLRESIGEDVVKALLTMRGGSNPDAISDMFSNVVYIEREDRWLWLPEGSRLLTLRTTPEMRQLLRGHPEYPPIPKTGKVGDVQIIDMVMTSVRKRRAGETVSFPGVPFGTCYAWEPDRNDYSALEDTPLQVDALNVSTGFATEPIPEGGMPDLKAWDKALFLWRRHRARLTQDIPLQNRKLDQLIARKIQKPRVKFQLGCALAGGQGTGKSALFNVILAPIIGPELIGHSNRAEMNTDFRYRQLDKSLFYVLEEFRISNAPPEVQESLKELMRSDTIERNRKYGRQDTCRNVAIPFILSNEKNPSLLVDGMRDRALVIINGISQESLGHTAEEWDREKTTIRDEVTEFSQALQDPNIRQALFHYWDHLDLDPAIFDDNESANTATDNVIATLPPIEQAIIDMLASGNIFSGRDGSSGPSIDDPFPLEGMAEALAIRIRKPVTVFEVGGAFASLFMDNKFKRSAKPNAQIDRDERDKMLRSKRWLHGIIRRRSYYLAKRRGEIGVWLAEYRNIVLDFEREMDQDLDFGMTPEPDKQTLVRAVERWATSGLPRTLSAP